MSPAASALGIDIGGTHATAAFVDLTAMVVESHVRADLPTDADRESLVSLILDTAATAASGRVGHVGVAVPGPFDYVHGICRLEHKLAPLFGVDLRHELSKRLAVPGEHVSFVNDADAFLLGEWSSGAARGHRRTVGITLGTGLGSSFLEDGRIIDDEFRVPPEGSLHLLTYRGAPVEETISRAALIVRYGSTGYDVDQIAVLARRGDERAQDAFAGLAAALGEVVAPWLASFQATCLVVGGSIAHAWDLLGPTLRRQVAGLERLEAVVPATRIDDSALLGAAFAAAAGAR